VTRPMPHALIVYATTHGHTGRIAERLAATLATEGITAERHELPGDPPGDVRGYDLVLVGASVHAGHHQREVVEWVTAHREALTEVPSSFFSVCLAAAEEAEDSRAAVRDYLDDFEERTGWTPSRRTTFAGALQYREYSFPVRQVMRLMMRHAGHDTDTGHDHDYTDWAAVEAWARASVVPAAA
jgi:menaquinone-dependent protoporphyrinogen oxidase